MAAAHSIIRPVNKRGKKPEKIKKSGKAAISFVFKIAYLITLIFAPH